MSRGPLIVLVGPMGVGKSTVGALLAERLGVPFLDTDQDVVHRTGRSVSEIVTEDGEPRFRELEHEAVARAVAAFPGSSPSAAEPSGTGAAAPCWPGCR